VPQFQIPIPGAVGTFYAHYRDATAQVYNFDSSQFQSYSSGQWANYSAAMSEQGGSKVYTPNQGDGFPAGDYLVVVYEQAGGSPAEGDLIRLSFTYSWDGFAIVTIRSRAAESSIDTVFDQLNDILAILPEDTQGFATTLLDDPDGVEVALTVREALRLIAAALAGELAGSPSGPIEIKGVGIETVRIEATVDASGNRTGVIIDVAD